MKRYAVAAVLLVAVAICVRQAQAEETGLAVSDYRNLDVVIDDPGPAAHRIGLTESVIRNRVELRLGTAGIKPTSGFLFSAHYLYVNIQVVGEAYHVRVSLNRDVKYFDGRREHSIVAPTWSTAGTGTHANDAMYILGVLDTQLDEFLNAYLRANQ